MKASTLTIMTLMIILTFSIEVNPNYSFQDYVRQFNKNYQEPEYSIRQEIFNLAFIRILESRVSGESTYTVGVNKFTDWTQEEKKNFNSMRVPNSNNRNLRAVKSPRQVTSSLLTPINYRTLGQVTSVKDQDICGGCWAFSSTAQYESLILIHDNENVDLSEQYLVSCSGAGSCSGGIPFDALNSIRTTGIPNETDYPFNPNFGPLSNTSSQCTSHAYNKLDNLVTGVQHFDDLTDYQLQQLLINHGPVSVGVSSGFEAFMAYESGVFDNCTPGAPIDHSVLLVGFTEDGDYIIKNSWGTYWGDDGYMTIKGSNDCGIKTYVDVVTVDTFSGPVNQTAEYENVTVLMTSTDSGWHGNVLGIIQQGQLVHTFGEEFTNGSSYDLIDLPIKKGVDAKVIFVVYVSFVEAVRFYMWAQGIPVFSSPPTSPYQSGYVFGTFCLGGCTVASVDSVFITLTDSGADGWNGNSLVFTQGVFSEEFGLNFTSGSTSGPLEFVVSVKTNFSILPYTLASDRTEVGFVVRDKYNNVIVQRLPGETYTAADLLATYCVGCLNYRPVQVRSSPIKVSGSNTKVSADNQQETQSLSYSTKGSDTDKEIVAISILAAIVLLLTILVCALVVIVLKMVNRSEDKMEVKSESAGKSGESASNLNENKETEIQQGM